MTRYVLPVEIEPLEEGGYLATCPLLQGCHAQGETIAEAIENVQDVAKVLLEIYAQDRKPIPSELQKVKPDTVLHNEIMVTADSR